MPGSSRTDRLTVVTTEATSGTDQFAHDVKAGFSACPKSLPCRYFYDAQGSLLFEQICDLPEYYVMRTERAILEQRAGELATRSPAGVSLVELGSGSAAKTRLLIRAFLDRCGSLRYVPIDGSRTMLEQSCLELVREFPSLHVLAVAGEYHEGLRELRARIEGPKLILWLGSSIGNLDLPDAEDFL